MITIDPATTVHIVNTRPEHAAPLAAMQHIMFPTLTQEELFSEAQYRKHIELFPEGQFCALVEEAGKTVVVGSTTTFRCNFDFNDTQHTFAEIIAYGWLTNHEPDGEWLYGADISVHPDYRGRRVGKLLYKARQALVHRLNLRGEIAGGMLPGYHYHRAKMSVHQYVLRVHQGVLHDPTLTMQIRNGFRVRGLLHNYITDPRVNNIATLLVRENPHYRPMERMARTG